MILKSCLCPSLLALASLGAVPMTLERPDIDESSETGFAQQLQTVACRLETGAASSCYSITVDYLPEDLEIGPFCPATLTDAGGIWEWTGENAKLYRVDETFLRMLDDPGHCFFDEGGAVHVVDAATDQPEVDHACINVSPNETVQITILLPVTPVMADSHTPL